MLRGLGLIFLFVQIACSNIPTANKEKAAVDQGSSEIPARREFPLNEKINPCEDFYGYACSQAIAGFKLREDRNRHIFSFSDSSERILLAKRAYFRELAGKAKLKKRPHQMKDFYLSCMNTETRKSEELKFVAETVKKIKNIKSREEFSDLLISESINGGEGFVTARPDSNLDQPIIHDLFLMPAWDLTSLPERSYYEKSEVTRDFKKVLEKFYQQIGVDKPAIHAENTLQFEKEFSQIHPLPREIRELWSTRNYVSREELLKNYPQLKLGEFFKLIPKKTKIRNLTAKSMEFLNKALATRDLEQLKYYYMYFKLNEDLDEAYPEYFQAAFQFRNKHLGGPVLRPELQERCTTLMMGLFNKELDAELMPVMFPNFNEKKFTSLLLKVKKSIINGLEKNTWLSVKARAGAIQKIKTAKFQVVAPKREKDWDFNPIGKYAPNAFIANQQQLYSLLAKKNFKRVAELKNINEWSMGPLTVNAYYSSDDNKFVMPVGILQYPFYDPSAPDHVNLGAVGAVVGHELGHGIDDQGSKYDWRGRLNQWMTDADLKEFHMRSGGLAEQFNKIGHDGKFTLGENIGDLVGVTFAFDAAFSSGQGAVEAKKDFFVQYARAWCGVVRPKEAERRLKTDPHAAIEARVREQVKNQQAFIEAYQCGPKDAMYLPVEKQIRVW